MRNYKSRLNNWISIFLVEAGAVFSKLPKQTGWKIQVQHDAAAGIMTSAGEKIATGLVSGVGRVADSYRHADGSLEVTFAHGKFATLLADGVVAHDWLPAHDGAAPLVHGPSQKIVEQFCKASFAICLLPTLKNGAWRVPVLKQRDLVAYKILTTDREGREGIAVEIQPAQVH